MNTKKKKKGIYDAYAFAGTERLDVVFNTGLPDYQGTKIVINDQSSDEGNDVVYYQRENGNRGYEQCSSGPSLLLAYVEHNGYVEGPAREGGEVSIMIESDYIDHYYKDGTIEISPYGNNGYLISVKGQWERMQFTQVLETLVKELKNIHK